MRLAVCVHDSAHLRALAFASTFARRSCIHGFKIACDHASWSKLLWARMTSDSRLACAGLSSQPVSSKFCVSCCEIAGILVELLITRLSRNGLSGFAARQGRVYAQTNAKARVPACCIPFLFYFDGNCQLRLRSRKNRLVVNSMSLSLRVELDLIASSATRC